MGSNLRRHTNHLIGVRGRIRKGSSVVSTTSLMMIMKIFLGWFSLVLGVGFSVPISRPRLVVFSFDAFRPDYINATVTPNLFYLAKNGVQARMRSTFVTKTFPNHQSIATGLYQTWHGIINNHFIDPETENDQEFTVKTGPSIFWWDMYNKSVPIYIANQLNGGCSGSMQWPGSIANYTDGQNADQRFRVDYLRKYNPDYHWYNNLETVFKWMTSESKPANLIMVYFDEPDTTAHKHGPFSVQTMKQVRRIDALIGHFLKRLQLLGLDQSTDLIILSDHGMLEMSMDRVIYLDKCNEQYPGLEFKLFGVSPVFSVLPLSKPDTTDDTGNDEDLIESVYRTLKDCSEVYYDDHFTVYKQSEIPAEYHYGSNRRILPIFIVSDEGYELVHERRNWIPKGFPIWGNHGWNNSLDSMKPMFIGNGPSFKSDYWHPITFDNVDLYPLMLNILRIPQKRFQNHNGTLDNVRDMLSG